MSIQHSEFSQTATLYIEADKETIAKILLYTTQLNADKIINAITNKQHPLLNQLEA